MMKTRILSLLLVATFVISTTAIAQQRERGNQWQKLSPEKKAMMLKKRQAMQKGQRQAFFTDEQKEAMKKLRLETAKEVKPFKNELRELAAHQKTLTTANKADLKAIYKNIDKMAEVKAEMAKTMAKQHQELRSLLNEEQLLKFDAMKVKKGKGQRGEFMHQRMNRGMQAPLKRGA